MKGISNVITTSAMLLIAVALMALVMPWAWNMVTQTTTGLSRLSSARENAILGNVYFLLPSAVNPSGKVQLLFIFNDGYIALTEAKVKMLDTNFNTYDLNFIVLRRTGQQVGTAAEPLQGIDVFYPGDVIVAFLPAEENYLGYQFVFQSREYSEAYRVGE